MTPEDILPGLGTSRNWLGPGKSSSVISPFSVSHLPEFLGWEECNGKFLNKVQRSSRRAQRRSCRVQRSSGRVQLAQGGCRVAQVGCSVDQVGCSLAQVGCSVDQVGSSLPYSSGGSALTCCTAGPSSNLGSAPQGNGKNEEKKYKK